MGNLSLDDVNFSGVLSALTIDANKDWQNKAIVNIGSLGSSVGSIPSAGFIRMGSIEEIRMRNVAGDDDLIIASGLDGLSGGLGLSGSEI